MNHDGDSRLAPGVSVVVVKDFQHANCLVEGSGDDLGWLDLPVNLEGSWDTVMLG